MNDRIKEILNKVVGVGTVALVHPDEVEKFADLLIGECIAICQQERNEHIESAANNNGRSSDFAFGSVNSAERIRDNIKEHFGVE